MEQPGPASDAHTMEGSEVKSASEGSPLESQLHDTTANVENEEQRSNKSADEAENYGQVKDEALSESGLMETTTDVETDTQTEPDAQACGQEDADAGYDDSTLSEEGGIPSFSKEAGGGAAAPGTSLDDVVESSPSVLEGTIHTSLTIDEAKVPQATAPNHSEDPSSASVTNCPTELSLVDDNGPAESPSPSSVQSTSKNSPTDSTTTTTTTSGISNGPSTPGSDTVSSSLASSPQTSANVSAPSHSSSSPFDTDCSRKLISQIQRSLSQESLLDELESELLDCQLPEGDGESERKGSPPVNGLQADQKDCMVVFEKCVQYKYAQQEKAIQR